MATDPKATQPTVSSSLGSFVSPDVLAAARAALEANK
jgi:hypothetical protein